MEGGGTLTIRARQDGARVLISISDTGRGIDPRHLPMIFDPFFTTKAVKKGTGLGLSVTYGIVQEHGGTIEVDSHLGAGTTFRLSFPPAEKVLPDLAGAAMNA
jgi:two-component system NtrC family sensor kinase